MSINKDKTIQLWHYAPALIILLVILTQVGQSIHLLQLNKYPKQIPYINFPYPFVFFTSAGWDPDNLPVLDAKINLNSDLIKSPYQKDIFYTLLGIVAATGPDKAQGVLCTFFDKNSYIVLKNRGKVTCQAN